MKLKLLSLFFALFLLPFVVMGQCGSNLFVNDADGNSYATLKVGPHCWMQSNLKTRVPGSSIYWADMYPDTTANLEIYGRLYNWYAAMNVQPGEMPVVKDPGFVQGVCPEGWHLPNDVEVAQLMTNTTPALRDVHYWLLPGTNTTNYTMRPGGYYNAIMNRSENLCGDSYMWTAQSLDESSPSIVWSDCHCDYFLIDKTAANNGMSVRCVYKIYQGTVTTDSATNITDKSATLYGTVAFNGYDEEYERGFVYGTSSDNLDQWVVENQAASEATAPFNKEITGLSAATTYYYQAYVVNDFDTAWGEIKDFTTLQMQVSTDSANTITHYAATLHGNLIYLDYASVNAGFKYGTSEDALTTIVSAESAMTAAGQFSFGITGLTANTQYYYKAFAANGSDTVYGEVKNFTTLTDVVTDTIAFLPNGGQGTMDTMFVTRGNTALNANTYTHGGNWQFTGWNTEADGSGTQYADRASITTNGNLTLYAQWHTYCTGTPQANESGTSRIDSVKDVNNNQYAVVQIGNQCWMKQNLRTTTNTANTGNIYTPTTTGYDVETYGLLYDWAAVMQGKSSTEYPAAGQVKVQGICPAGWHVPSSNEWDTLNTYVNSVTEYRCGGTDKAIAKSLAATMGWNPNNTACRIGNLLSHNNATGFSALPAGNINSNNPQSHNGFGKSTLFASATVGSSDTNYCAELLNSIFPHAGIKQNTQSVECISVRCVRDTEEPPFTCGTSKVKDIDNNEYNTVPIGNQCWMAQNLRTNVGSGVYPKKGDTELTADEQVTYGRLYTWDAMMSGSPSTNYPAGNTAADTIVHGICPTGWHVPSDAEWTQLTDYVNTEANGYRCNGDETIANALSAATGWNSSSSDGCNAGNTGDKANATGFAAVPAGAYDYGYYNYFGEFAYFWSATEDGGSYAYRGLYFDYARVHRSNNDDKYKGFSVRCLRD